MSKESSENVMQERELKKQIAFIMTSFEDAMESYSSNRKQLDQMLNQLLKVYRTYKIYKSPNRTITKNNSKQDLYFQFCLLNNISCCYSTKKENTKACEYIKLADKQLKSILQLLQKSQLDYETRKIQTINLHMRMIRLKLQLCGVYALNVQHIQSLHQSSQAFGLLENVINSVCDYSMGEKFNQDFLQLQKCIAEPNTQISQKQIKNSYWNNIMNCQSDQQVKTIFLNIFKNYHSKQQTQARSCLGKIISSKQEKAQIISPQSKKYLKQFSIGSIMKISPIMLDQFNRARKKQDYVNLRFLHQLTILLSLTHFTVSTELRLCSMYDQESTGIQSFVQEDINMVKKQKRMIEAERHHFFAVQIIYKMATPYVRQCPFFGRLVKGYQQVYLLKDNFEIIPEKVQEQNQISLLSIKNKGNRYDYKEQQDYYLKKMKDSKCQTPRSLAKKQLRADLYRMRKKKQQQQKGQKPKNLRKTPSTHKSTQFLSPKLPPKGLNKSRQKQIKLGSRTNRGLEKAVSPGMRKSRNQMGPKSPHKDYTNY